MKILVINWQDIKNPSGGGAEVHFHEIFKRIVAMNHSVTLFCSRFEGAPTEETIDGIKVIRQGSRNLFNFYVPIRYFKQFRKENYDIIIDDINKIPFYTPLYVKEPLLAISHHFFGKSIFPEAGIIAGSYVYLSEKIIDYVYKKTPFAVVSQSTKDEFLSRGFPEDLFSMVPNAITPEDFPMKIGQKESFPLITYFGRMKKYKSVHHLVKAFAIISKQLPQAQLYLIGKGDYQPELEKLAKELNISEKTTFWGYVSENEKSRLLSLSHCVVNTSMKEGWGITNIEANACGAPVISANVPGLRDSVSEGLSGLLYEYGDINQLADIIIRFFADKDLQNKLYNGSIAWAKQFTWDESAKLMIAKCNDVISKSKN